MFPFYSSRYGTSLNDLRIVWDAKYCTTAEPSRLTSGQMMSEDTQVVTLQQALEVHSTTEAEATR